MAMKKREKILAGAVGGLLILLVGRVLFSSGSDAPTIADPEAEYQKLSKDVKDKTARLVALQKKTTLKLADWNRRSLPADPKTARPLYEKWFVGLVEKVGFTKTTLDPGEQRMRSGAYTAIPLSIRGQGTLDQLVKFLYEFYSAGTLHKIRTIRVKPAEGGRSFDFVIAVEALSLPTAKSRDSLPTGVTGRLDLADLAAYRTAIGRRRMEADRIAESGGFFAPYSPPPPPPRPPVAHVEPKRPPPEPPKPPTPSFDASKYAYVTAITEIDGKPQAWIHIRTEGESIRLGEGESIHIGSINGKITRIAPQHVEIEVDGQRRIIPLGKNLQGTQEKTADGS